MGFGFAIMFYAIEWARKRALSAASESATPATPPSATRRRFFPWLVFLVLGIAVFGLVRFANTTPPKPAAAESAWTLDAVITDHRAWPPQTLPPDRALPVAGAALALLGSCDARQLATPEDWRGAETTPHLRLDYPRAGEGKMPDVILIPLPLTDATTLWTRKAGTVTRHTRFSREKATRLEHELGSSAPLIGQFKFSRSREITLPRARPTAYDFDQGRFVDYMPSPRSPHGIESSPHWHAEQGTDVFADPNSHRPGLLLLGADVFEAPAEIWDAPAKAVTAYAAAPDRGLMAFVPAPDPGSSPATHVYRTPQGGVILMQLLRANDSGDVTLRYKTVRPAPGLPLFIKVADDGTTSIDGASLDASDLRALLRDRARAKPDVAVHLLPDLGTTAVSIHAVMQACAEAGITNLHVEQAAAAIKFTPPEERRPLRLDRAGDTMQTIVQRLRQEHGLRICFENLDFTPADAVTLGARLRELGAKEAAGSLTATEAELLRHARRLRDSEKLGPDTLIDVGPRYSGIIDGETPARFLERLVAGTVYSVRQLGAIWLVQPRTDSRLAFPVTLNTAGLTVGQAVLALIAQAPADQPIAAGLVITGPFTPGADPTPWLSAPAPSLDFQALPAAEALCRLAESSRPAFLWELAGYRDRRMLSFAPAPTGN
jgi:biopolymer transport protein ExbD